MNRSNNSSKFLKKISGRSQFQPASLRALGVDSPSKEKKVGKIESGKTYGVGVGP